jgi:hypothetical protein
MKTLLYPLMKVALVLALSLFGPSADASIGHNLRCLSLFTGGAIAPVFAILSPAVLAALPKKHAAIKKNLLKDLAKMMAIYTGLSVVAMPLNEIYFEASFSDALKAAQAEAMNPFRRVLLIDAVGGSASRFREQLYKQYAGAQIQEITTPNANSLMNQLAQLDAQINLPFDSIIILAHGTPGNIWLGTDGLICNHWDLRLSKYDAQWNFNTAENLIFFGSCT